MAEQTKTRRNDQLPEGIERREGERGASIRVTFAWLGKRRRETLRVPDTPANIRYAERLRAEVINAIERGTFEYAKYFPNSKIAKIQNQGKRRHLVTDLLDTYIETARKAKILSPSSIATYAKWNHARLQPKFAGRFVDDLNTMELRTWIADLASELSPKSTRNCIGVLSSVLNVAVIDGFILTNPLGPIKLRTLIPKKRREDDKIDPFNAVEITAILAACPSIEERSLFQFAFATGMRTGELIAIKWDHIDERTQTVHVQDNIVSGEKGTVEKTTKTDCERRVPILSAAKSALAAMKPISTMRQIGGFIFTTPEGQRWRDDHQIRGRWRIILRKAKVRYRNPYQTRHTFASTLLMAGEPELLVAELLGHATVEMIRRSYGKYIKQEDGKIKLRGDYDSSFGSPAPPVPQISKGTI